MAALNAPLTLAERQDVPPGLLDVRADRLHTVLPGPTLIHLPGRREAPLFVSVLLHGNETTGLEAVQRLLAKYRDRSLPRALSIFFGNVEAARAGVRRLDHQPDYNRSWPGTLLAPCAETLMMAEVTTRMARRGVFASIDVHNNTGRNPHYACVNRLQPAFLQLAALFGRLVIHFTHPRGTQTAAFAALCPAVTLECGKSEHRHGADHAFEYLDGCLHLAQMPDHPIASHALDLYHTVVQVTIRDDCRFGFAETPVDLRLNDDIDHFNFTDLPAGTVLGRVAPDFPGLPVRAIDETGEDRAADYFAIRDGQLVLARGVMPSMFTLNERIIRQDCLAYLMERMAIPDAPRA